MNHSFSDPHSLSRTLIAFLITSLMILSPLAPLAQGAPSFTRVGTNSNVEPPAPFAPVIAATKVDSFPDVDGDGKASPGEIVTYDVNISNTGPDDATNVNFSDTIDANTTLVPGSLKVSPLAFADTFAAAKNTPLVVSAPGVLTNDTGLPAPTAVPIAGGATTQGGTVTLNADGSFNYNPPADFEGNDSFTYTATNGLTPNDTAIVTLNVDAPPSVASTTPTNGAIELHRIPTSPSRLAKPSMLLATGSRSPARRAEHTRSPTPLSRVVQLRSRSIQIVIFLPLKPALSLSLQHRSAIRTQSIRLTLWRQTLFSVLPLLNKSSPRL